MGARKTESPAMKIAKPFLVGVGVSLAVGLVILLLAALVMTTGTIPSSVVTPIALVTMALAAFVGGIVSALVSRERGLLYGAGCGLFLFLLVTVLGMALSQELRGMMMLIKAALAIGSGAFGGVLGVNRKRR